MAYLISPIEKPTLEKNKIKNRFNIYKNMLIESIAIEKKLIAKRNSTSLQEFLVIIGSLEEILELANNLPYLGIFGFTIEASSSEERQELSLKNISSPYFKVIL